MQHARQEKRMRRGGKEITPDRKKEHARRERDHALQEE